MRPVCLLSVSIALVGFGGPVVGEPPRRDPKPAVVSARLVGVRIPRNDHVGYFEVKLQTRDKDRRELFLVLLAGRNDIPPHQRTLVAVLRACYPDGITDEFVAPKAEAVFSVPTGGVGYDGKGLDQCALESLALPKGQ